MLAIIGAGVFLLSALGATLAMGALIIDRQNGLGGNPTSFAIIGWAGSLGRTIGMACLVGAIFAGRTPTDPQSMPMVPPPGQGYAPPSNPYAPPRQ